MRILHPLRILHKSVASPRATALLLFFVCGLTLNAQSFTLTTIAGIPNFGDGKSALSVPLLRPTGVAQASDGTIYIAEGDRNLIRRISPAGTLSTIAGTGDRGYTGDGGPALQAQFSYPTTIRLDGRGGLLILDRGNFRIRRLNLATGTVTSVVGNGHPDYSGDGGPALEAGMYATDFSVDSSANIYIADGPNNRIRKVAASTGLIATLAGNGLRGYDDGVPGAFATFRNPSSLALDGQGNVYVVDRENYCIRKISANGDHVSTLAGSGDPGDDASGPALSVNLREPRSIAISPTGAIVVAGKGFIYSIPASPSGNVSLISGSLDAGFDDGNPDGARWSFELTVAFAPDNTLLVADRGNYRVRRIATAVTTVAGRGAADIVPIPEVSFGTPQSVTYDWRGGILVADRGYHLIQLLFAGLAVPVIGDGYEDVDPFALPAPDAVAVDAQRNIYVASIKAGKIIRRTAGGMTEDVLGGGTTYMPSTNPLPATQMRGIEPSAMAIDTNGDAYVANQNGCTILRVRAGLAGIVAGTNICGISVGLGAGPQVILGHPGGIALDRVGGLLISDPENHRILRLDLATGILTLAPGGGVLNSPGAMAVDAAGRVAVVESNLHQIYLINAQGGVRLIAGTGERHSSALAGAATAVAFDPTSMAFDTDGSIVVTDTANALLRRLVPAVPSKVQVIEGANATGAAGTAVSLAVKVSEANDTPIAGFPVNFAVAVGSASLSNAMAETGTDGVARISVLLGPVPGPLSIRASVDGVAPVTIFMLANPAAPSLDAGGVIGAGQSIPSIRAGSVGAILSAYGKSLGPGPSFRAVTPADLVAGRVPTQFAGICVEVGGVRAPVFGASDTLVNFQFPAVPLGAADVRVISGCGTANEVPTNPQNIAVQSASPEFFYFVPTLSGVNAIAARAATTGALVGPSALLPGSGMRPAKPGELVTLYGTGFGRTNPLVEPGVFATGAASVTGSYRVLFNGQPLPAEDVLYVGVTPQSPGLFQVNFRVPQNAATGNNAIVLEIDGYQSSPGGYLAVAP